MSLIALFLTLTAPILQIEYRFVPFSRSERFETHKTSKPVSADLAMIPSYQGKPKEIWCNDRPTGLVIPSDANVAVVGFDAKRKPIGRVYGSASGAYTVSGSRTFRWNSKGYKVAKLPVEADVMDVQFNLKGDLVCLSKKNGPFNTDNLISNCHDGYAKISGRWISFGKCLSITINKQSEIAGAKAFLKSDGNVYGNGFTWKKGIETPLANAMFVLSDDHGNVVGLGPRKIEFSYSPKQGLRDAESLNQLGYMMAINGPVKAFFGEQGVIIERSNRIKVLSSLVKMPKGIGIRAIRRIFDDGRLWIQTQQQSKDDSDGWLVPIKLTNL